MLHIESVHNTEQKQKLLANLDPEKDCLIVSDLRSKFEWQNYYLEKYGIIEEEFIFRPSDLWRLLGKTLFPEYRWVSRELVTSYLSDQLKSREEEFLRTPNAASTAYSYITQLSPLFQHPQGRDLIKDWFKENIEAFHRWGHWFFIAEEMWEHCSEKKMLCQSWIPSLIYSAIEEIPIYWQRNFHIDLGLEIKYIEAEIFSRIAKETEIELNVLIPVMEKSFQFSSEYESYRPFLFGEQSASLLKLLSKESLESKLSNSKIEKLKSVKRYASSLSEVKDIVASTRILLDSGVELSDIAIVSTDIGELWPVLRYYLDKEGIPCQRPYNAGAQSFKEIYHWLAEIKVTSKKWTSADLELSVFSQKEKLIDKDKFLRLFSQIYGAEDLQRSSSLWNHYAQKEAKYFDKMNRDQFLVWALSLWPSDSLTSALEQIVKSVLTETKGLKFSLGDWIQYLGKICAKLEVNIRTGDPNAIVCIDLASSEYIASRYVFFLGMTDESFRRKSPLRAVNQKDIYSLRDSTGFPFSPEEDRALEFYLEWFCQKDSLLALYFSFAASNWSGTNCAPSVLWMKAKNQMQEDIAVVDIPKDTRLDSLQKQDLESLVSVYNNRQDLSEAVSRDMGSKNILSPSTLEKFSATSFKEFSLCPFRYAAKYKMHLSKLPPLDLDIDRMREGNIVHKIFEKALKQNLVSTDEKAIQACVEKIVEESRNEIGDQRRWESLRFRYQKILKKFLLFEEEWKRDFPDTEHFLQEYALDVHYNRELQCFEDKPGEPRFRGIVDRIDRHLDSATIIDYKMSKGNYKNFNSWLEDDDVQLLLYSKVVLDKIIPGVQNVSSAVYYSLKPWQRSTGFVNTEANPSFAPVSDKKRNKIENSELNVLIDLLSEKLSHFFSEIEKGNLYPRPKKPEETCIHCDWKNICRSPHLNY